MANPTPNPNPVFGGGTGAGSASNVFGTKPAVATKAPSSGTPVAKKPDTQNRNFFQDFFDVLGIPNALIAGGWNAALSPKGRAWAESLTSKNPQNPGYILDAAVSNALAPWQGKNRAYSADVLKQAGVGEGKDITVPVPFTEAKLHGRELLGLGLDITTDPTNVIPGRVVTGAIKAVTKGGTTAAKVGIEAAKGIVPKEITKARPVAQDVAPKIINTPKSFIKSGFKETDQNAGGALLREKLPKLYGKQIQLEKLTDSRSTWQAATDVAKSATLGAWRGMTLSASQSLLKNDLGNIAKQIAKATKKDSYIYDATEEAIKAADNIAPDVAKAVDNAAPEVATAAEKVKAPKEPLKPIDTAPLPNAVSELAANATPKSIEEAKQALDAANAVAKKIRVPLADAAEQAGKAIDILKSAGKPVEAVVRDEKLSAEFARALKDPSPESLQGFISNTYGTQGAAVDKFLKTINKKTFIAETGQEIPLGSIFQSIRQGRKAFGQYSKADQQAIREALNAAIAAPTGGSSAKAVVKQLSDLLGEKTTREIVSTGAVNGLTPENTAAVYDILKNLPSGKTKGYKSASEAIAGIRNGENISPNNLFKLLQALDPENKLVLEGQKAATTADGVKAMKGLLVGKGANTIKATERRLAALDPEHLLNSDNIPFSEAARFAADRALQGIRSTEAEILRETRQGQMAIIEKLESGETRQLVDDAINSIGRGLRGQMSLVAKAINEGATIHENVFGRVAVSMVENGKVTKSYLPELFAQYTETKMWASFLAKESTLRDFAKARALKKKEAVSFSRTRFDKLAESYTAARAAIMATFGVRIINVRSVKEAGAVDKGYNVYSDFGDFAEVAAQAEKSADADIQKLAQSANEAFFPVDSGVKTGSTGAKAYRVENSFSPQGVTRAINKLLESMDKKIDYPVDAMVEDILSRAPGDTRKWAKGFADKAEARARDIAAMILANKEFFAAKHQARMLAEIEDMARPAQIMAADIFTPILDAARAYTERGTLTLEQRSQLVSDALHKFVIGSDLLDQQNGYIAMTAFRSAAKMFMTIGGIEDALKLTKNAVDDLPLAGRFLKAASLMRRNNELSIEFERFVDGINTYSIAMGKTDNLLPYATRSVRDGLRVKLTAAESAYAETITKLLAGVDPAELAQVEKEFKTAQRALDKARKAATDVGMATRHWSVEKFMDGNPDGWIPSSTYNRASEESFINRVAAGVPADSISKKAEIKVTPAEKKQVKSNLIQQNLDAVESAIAEGGDTAASKVSQVEQLFPGDEIEQGMRIAEEDAIAPGRSSVIKIDQPSDFIYSTTYGDLKASRFGELNMEKTSLFSRFLNQFGATGSKAIANALRNSAESQLLNTVSDVHQALLRLMKTFDARQTTGEQFSKAFTLAASGMKVLTGEKNVDDLAKYLHQIIGATVAQMRAMKVDPDILNAMLRKHGLTPDNGFVDVSQMSDPESLFSIFETMPFSPKPEFDMTDDVEKAMSNAWDERQAKWVKYTERKHLKGQADTEFSVLAKTIDSIQFAITQQTLSAEVIKRFNFAAEGLTKEEALKRGYVRVIGSGHAANFLASHSNSPENLFHPEIARSIAWVNREYNKVFNGKQMNNVLQGILQMTQFYKATQTVLRPGHWVATIVGDTTTAMLAGVVNPVHWGTAIKLAKEFAKENLKADTRIFGEMQNAIDRSLQSIKGVGGRSFDMTVKKGQDAVQFVIDGRRVKLSVAELLRHMKDANIATSDIHVNDAALLYQEIASHAGGTGEGMSAAFSKLKTGFSRNTLGMVGAKIVKPAGDAIAYISNVPRMAHALKVMQERNYPSLKEALEAANDQINLYHPSIQSLSAGERRARVAFNYYTWLRVAHNTAIHLLLNHTGVTQIPNKIFYNQAVSAGLNPQSAGNLWGDKSQTPDYMNGSVYGPTATGVRGPMVYKPSIITLDVADTYAGLQYDPTMSADANMWANINAAGKIVASQTNMVIQPPLGAFFHTDLSTMRPETISSTPQMVDKYVNMFGFMKALQAIGAYTPFKKIDNTKNPLTQRDRQISGLNWMTGLRQQDINTPSNIKNANTQRNAKMKRVTQSIVDQLKQGNK